MKTLLTALLIILYLSVNGQIEPFKVKKGWSYIYVSEQNECKNIEKTVHVLDIKKGYVIFSYRYGLAIDRFERHYMKYDEFVKMVTNQK